AGLRAVRTSSPSASATLLRPVGFAWRLQRSMIVGWTVGLFVLGASYGSIFGDLETFFEDFEGFDELIPGADSGELTVGFLALVTTVMAVIAACSAILSAQKLRGEESAGRAEPLVVAGLSRRRWVGAHALVAAGG